VAKVARRVGYADTDHFSRLFRERFGTSPSAYPPAEDA
jgi:transcriptional regulator GlxA family with amidase domain